MERPHVRAADKVFSGESAICCTDHDPAFPREGACCTAKTPQGACCPPKPELPAETACCGGSQGMAA